MASAILIWTFGLQPSLWRTPKPPLPIRQVGVRVAPIHAEEHARIHVEERAMAHAGIRAKARVWVANDEPGWHRSNGTGWASDDAQFACLRQQLGAIVDRELGIDIFDMPANRACPQDEIIRDFVG